MNMDKKDGFKLWKTVVALENNLLRADLYIFSNNFPTWCRFGRSKYVLWNSDSSGQHQCFRLKIFMRRFTLQFNVSMDISSLLTTYFVT